MLAQWREQWWSSSWCPTVVTEGCEGRGRGTHALTAVGDEAASRMTCDGSRLSRTPSKTSRSDAATRTATQPPAKPFPFRHA
eukprot:531958-Rhodomonas_salina.2